MEDVFFWDSMTGANEHFRGATGGGDGVHVLTGPIFVEDAEPGDMLKVEILDLQPRKNPVTGKTFGSNAAAWWGFQARVKMVDGSDFSAGQFTNTPVGQDELFQRSHIFCTSSKAHEIVLPFGNSDHRVKMTK